MNVSVQVKGSRARLVMAWGSWFAGCLRAMDVDGLHLLSQATFGGRPGVLGSAVYFLQNGRVTNGCSGALVAAGEWLVKMREAYRIPAPPGPIEDFASVVGVSR